jgi:hypothetical protein
VTQLGGRPDLIGLRRELLIGLRRELVGDHGRRLVVMPPSATSR